jgi:hypothetical protein
LHRVLLKRLREHNQIDWGRGSIDGATVASLREGGRADWAAPNGSLQGPDLVVDPRAVSLALMITGANRHNSVVFEALVDAIPSMPGFSGRPRCRPDKLHADEGYDFARCRQHLRVGGICPRIARRGIEKNDRLGKHRWVVERTHAWLAGFGKLRIRFERSLLTLISLCSP